MSIRFRMKPGMGVHYRRQGGKLVRVHPGDIISCELEELKVALDKFEQLDPTPPSPPPPQPRVGLRMVHRGGGQYNVVNEATGEKLNDELLTKEEAQELINTASPAEGGKSKKSTSTTSKKKEDDKGGNEKTEP